MHERGAVMRLFLFVCQSKSYNIPHFIRVCCTMATGRAHPYGGRESGRAHPHRGIGPHAISVWKNLGRAHPLNKRKGVPRFTLYCLIQTVMVRLL